MEFYVKTRREVTLFLDPPHVNSISSQNQPICNKPPYIAINFEPMMQFKKSCEIGMSHKMVKLLQKLKRKSKSFIILAY